MEYYIGVAVKLIDLLNEQEPDSGRFEAIDYCISHGKLCENSRDFIEITVLKLKDYICIKCYG